MKLFKPVVHWTELSNTARQVRLTILGDTTHSMTLVVDRAAKTDETTFEPEEIPSSTPPEQLVFLAGLWATFKVPLMLWLTSSDEEVTQAALGALGEMAVAIGRNIEYMPNSAEHMIEVHLRSDLAGIPPHLGSMFFGEEVKQDQVEAQSELEKQLAEKYKDVDPREVAARLTNEMPAASYAIMDPEVPKESFAALERRRQAYRLAHMPVAGQG